MGNAELIKAGSSIAAYSQFRAQLAELKHNNKVAVFDYADPKGNKEARSHIYKLRQTKSAVEKVRKEEKAASLEYGRRVDAEAKQIIGEIDGMIEIHQKPIDEIERKEAERVQKIRDVIEEMRAAAVTENPPGVLLSAEVMRDRLDEIKAIAIDESFAEFSVEAAHVKDATISLMEINIAAAEKREAEAAELARLRKEAEDRARADREEQIRREAAERATKEAAEKAEQERIRAEAEAKAAKEAAAHRELELKLAAERAEREKIEANQRAERAAKEAEERLRREAEEVKRKEAEEAAKREANKKHKAAINNAAVAALVAGGISKQDATTAITLIAKGEVPAVRISY